MFSRQIRMRNFNSLMNGMEATKNLGSCKSPAKVVARKCHQLAALTYFEVGNLRQGQKRMQVWRAIGTPYWRRLHPNHSEFNFYKCSDLTLDLQSQNLGSWDPIPSVWAEPHYISQLPVRSDSLSAPLPGQKCLWKCISRLGARRELRGGGAEILLCIGNYWPCSRRE